MLTRTTLSWRRATSTETSSPRAGCLPAGDTTGFKHIAVVVERVGLRGSSLTFRTGSTLYGCDKIPNPFTAEDPDLPYGGIRCASPNGRFDEGGLNDPRLSLCPNTKTMSLPSYGPSRRRTRSGSSFRRRKTRSPRESCRRVARALATLRTAGNPRTRGPRSMSRSTRPMAVSSGVHARCSRSRIATPAKLRARERDSRRSRFRDRSTTSATDEFYAASSTAGFRRAKRPLWSMRGRTDSPCPKCRKSGTTRSSSSGSIVRRWADLHRRPWHAARNAGLPR